MGPGTPLQPQSIASSKLMWHLGVDIASIRQRDILDLYETVICTRIVSTNSYNIVDYAHVV